MSEPQRLLEDNPDRAQWLLASAGAPAYVPVAALAEAAGCDEQIPRADIRSGKLRAFEIGLKPDSSKPKVVIRLEDAVLWLQTRPQPYTYRPRPKMRKRSRA